MSLYCFQYYLNYVSHKLKKTQSGPFITDSLREYRMTLKSRDAKFYMFLTVIQKHFFQINIFYKTFPALIYKQFLCYDVTIRTGLLSRLHLQKQAV
jgi:hypothetical protein